MSHSSLFDTDGGAGGAPGHDIASLGPSDTSDSGSDMAGAEGIESDDPLLPIDVALSRDGWQAGSTSRLSSDSDSSGTGEGGAAGGSGSVSEASDIRPDHLVAIDELDEDTAADAGLDPGEILLAAMAIDDAGDASDDELDESRVPNGPAPRDPTLVPKVRKGSR